MTPRQILTSTKIGWNTPKELYKQLDQEFHFDYDPCPDSHGELHKFDGLGDWEGKSIFVNPPYGKTLGSWVERGVIEYRKGKTVVMLLPSRTDTIWFHNYVLPNAKEIRFIRGRLSFTDQEGSLSSSGEK
ncbi:MAG: DNA N-6-adenine-methyltransferase [Nitrososphaerales archaeon]